MADRLKRINSAHVIAVAALFVALGSTAWALTRNEVKSKHIAANAVRAGDVKNLKWRALPANGACDKISTVDDTFRDPAAAVDNEGMIHLRGGYINCDTGPMVVLPAKYRPNKILLQPISNGGAPAILSIHPDGQALYSGGGGSFKSMEGISYAKR